MNKSLCLNEMNHKCKIIQKKKLEGTQQLAMLLLPPDGSFLSLYSKAPETIFKGYIFICRSAALFWS